MWQQEKDDTFKQLCKRSIFTKKKHNVATYPNEI